MMKRYAWVTLVVASSCGVPEGPVSPPSETVTDLSAIARHGGTLAVGGMEACTRRGDGYWCWGTSDEAGFGRSGGCANGVFCETAWRVPELDRAVQVVFSPIGKACLVNGGGQLWCRGAVTAPGRGEAARATTRWQFDAPVVDVALGGGFFCVRHPSGTVSCWGDVIFRHGPAPARPGPVLGLADATQLAAGSQHACALRQNGTVVCWGSNRAGQLGTKSDTACAKGDVAACELVPALVEGLTDVAELSAGDYFTCARKRSGAVFCWGIDQIGELGEVATETCEPPLVPIGRGQSPCSRSPLRVRGIDDAVRIASGSHHSCAVLATGRVVCWGSDLLVELGVPAPEKCPPNGAVGYACSSRPIDVGLADVVDVAVSGIFHPLGGGYSCAETRARDVHCWGARGDFVPGVPGLAAGAPPFIRKIAFSD